MHYRAIMPDGGRHYRVDILRASLQPDASIWVNGDKFDFKQEVTERARILKRHHRDLCTWLARYGGDQQPAGQEGQRIDLPNSPNSVSEDSDPESVQSGCFSPKRKSKSA